jgi:hypothetical protein
MIYLSHKNEAGRLLALSRIGAAGSQEDCLAVLCPDDQDYLQSQAYAEKHKCNIVIL